jgi:hypothetical protein
MSNNKNIKFLWNIFKRVLNFIIVAHPSITNQPQSILVPFFVKIKCYQNCVIKLISWFRYCRHLLSLILGSVYSRGWMEKKINSVTWICNIGNFYWEWISCVSNFIIESLLNLWRLNLMKFKTVSRAWRELGKKRVFMIVIVSSPPTHSRCILWVSALTIEL